MVTAMCPACGSEFKRTRSRTTYCSDTCRHSRVKVSITTGGAKPARKHEMTNDEFEAVYRRIQKELQRQGKPLIDPEWRLRPIGLSSQKRVSLRTDTNTHVTE